MLMKPLRLSLRLGMPWLLPVALSAQACLVPSLDSSHKQDPGAIWGARRQPGSRALLALNTPRQAHLNIHGKPQSFQTHGYNRGIWSHCLSPQPAPKVLPCQLGSVTRTRAIAHTITHGAGLRGEHSMVQ